MDGRKLGALLTFLATALAGCDQKRLLPIWPAKTPKVPEVPVIEKTTKKEPIVLKPETLVAMARVWEQQAKEPTVTAQQREYFHDQARRAYQRALTIDAKCVSAHLGLAQLHQAIGNHERSMEEYQEVLKLEPKNAALYYEIGMVLARRKEWDRSLEMLRQAVDLDPDNRPLVRSYGLALARAGRITESLQQLQLVLNEAEAHCMIARMMHHMKQEDACRHHLQIALQLDANLPAAQDLQKELQGALQADADRPTSATLEAAHPPALPTKPAQPKTIDLDTSAKEPQAPPPQEDAREVVPATASVEPERAQPENIDLDALDRESVDLEIMPVDPPKE